MAVTHQDYTGNGSTTAYNITAFPFLETSDVKVSVAGVTKTVVNDYNVSGTTLTFTSTAIPPNNSAIRIYRNTNADTPKHTYQAGASVKEADLNNNQKQVLYKLQEVNTATASGTGLALVAGDKNDITVNGANDWVIRTDAIETAMIADNAITGAKFGNASISTTKIADDAVTADKLANSINTEIAANTAKTTNATHTGEVTGATALTITDNVVDEANLKISNAGSNGQYLQKQSGNTGGLTWAALPATGVLKNLVTATTTTEVDMNQTMTDSGLTCNITPTSSNHKVLVIVQQAYKIVDSDGGFYFQMKLFKDSTELVHRTMNHDASSSANNEQDFHTLIYLDSPGTTSQITYKMQMKGGENDAKAQPGGQRSDIFLLELNI